MPAATHVPDIEHMLKNISKKKASTADDEQTRVPRMRSNREQYTWVRCSTSLRFCRALLYSWFACKAQRMKEGWGETEFHDYFIKEYLYPARVQPAVYGVDEVLTARWFYGLGSPLASGHCPTWQTTEQSHRQFKRALTDSAQRTVLTVLASVKETVELWSSERTTEEDAYSLFTLQGFTASRPTRPDAWMVSGKLLHTIRVPGQAVTMLPAIKRLLEAEISSFLIFTGAQDFKKI